MERLYSNDFNKKRLCVYVLIENQLEFLYENEFGAITEIIDSMSEKEYERFLDDLWNDFMDDTNIWQEIDDNITEKVQKRVQKRLERGELKWPT